MISDSYNNRYKKPYNGKQLINMNAVANVILRTFKEIIKLKIL